MQLGWTKIAQICRVHGQIEHHVHISLLVWDLFADPPIVIGSITCVEIPQYQWLKYVPDTGSNWIFYYSPEYAELYPNAVRQSEGDTSVGFFGRDVYSVCGFTLE